MMMSMGSHPWKSWVCVKSEGTDYCQLKQDLVVLFPVAGTCSHLTRAASSHRMA